jgi:hypothetical protein
VMLEVLLTWAPSTAISTWLAFNITNVWALPPSPAPSRYGCGCYAPPSWTYCLQ